MNKPDESHFVQANERLKVLGQRWYDGQIDLEHYRDERREILDFLSGYARLPEQDLPELQPYPVKRAKRRWWWPIG